MSENSHVKVTIGLVLVIAGALLTGTWAVAQAWQELTSTTLLVRDLAHSMQSLADTTRKSTYVQSQNTHDIADLISLTRAENKEHNEMKLSIGALKGTLDEIQRRESH